MENEIDNNLDALAGVTGRLNQLARITGEEVDLQNKQLDEISRRVRSSLSFRITIVSLLTTCL